jgi:methylmalonyl-CoA mutase N-terminal domain/subunit
MILQSDALRRKCGQPQFTILHLMTASVEFGRSAHLSTSATYADWRATVEQELKGVPIEKRIVTRTPEGIDVQPLYRREDAAALKLTAAPGEPPYLRLLNERLGHA